MSEDVFYKAIKVTSRVALPMPMTAKMCMNFIAMMEEQMRVDQNQSKIVNIEMCEPVEKQSGTPPVDRTMN